MSTASERVSFALPASATMASFFRRWWLLLAAFFLVYGQVLPTMIKEWWTNDDYAHGLLTPFALAYLIYERRKEIFEIKANPSTFGFLAILASQVLLIVGFLGAEFFLQRVSMLMFLAGLILFIWGWQALSKTYFSLILILLAIPLPAIVSNVITLPLQLFASAWAESILDVLQIPVFREGNILQLPNNVLLNVAEACSGIRSLVSLIALSTLTTMLSSFNSMRRWMRVAFTLSSIPVALAANAFRVTGTGMLAYRFGEKAAQGFYHTFSGAVVFIFAFALLLGEMMLIQRSGVPEKKVLQ